MCHIWSRWNSAEIIDVCCENALQGVRFGHNGRNVIQKNNSLLSVGNVGCLNEAVHTQVVTLIWGGFQSGIARIWRAGHCFHVNRAVWELVPSAGDKTAQRAEFRLDSKVCFPCRKHKQPIKLQPRKILWHIRSPKRLRNSAINPHKPDTRHNRMTPTQPCSASGRGNQWVTPHLMFLLNLTKLNHYILSDFCPMFVCWNGNVQRNKKPMS